MTTGPTILLGRPVITLAPAMLGVMVPMWTFTGVSLCESDRITLPMVNPDAGQLMLEGRLHPVITESAAATALLRLVLATTPVVVRRLPKMVMMPRLTIPVNLLVAQLKRGECRETLVPPMIALKLFTLVVARAKVLAMVLSEARL